MRMYLEEDAHILINLDDPRKLYINIFIKCIAAIIRK